MNEALQEKIRRELLESFGRIKAEIAPELIPDEGMELACAIQRARTPEDVGSVLIKNREPDSMPEIAFGKTSSTVSGLLTALRFAPEMRCASTIRYSEPLQKIIGDMLFEVCLIDDGKIPPGMSTMDWAVAFCSEEESGVPDFLLVKSRESREIQVRMFAEHPGQAATNLIKISQRIIDATH